MEQMVETARGLLAQSELTTKLAVVDRGEDVIGVRHWLHNGEVVRQDLDTPVPKVDGRISTMLGMLPLEELDTTLVETDEGQCLAVGIERRVRATGELARRDVWVTAKRGFQLGVIEGAF